MRQSFAHVAQLVEHTLGKGEVSGSNPLMSSSLGFLQYNLSQALAWVKLKSFRMWLKLICLKASSSIGRAAVSKTAGWGFDSLLACHPFGR